MQQLDLLPRTEVASKRAALNKLLKDFDRIKVTMNSISTEAASIKVSFDVDNKSNIDNSKYNSNNLNNKYGVSVSNDNNNKDSLNSVFSKSQSSSQNQQQRQQQLLMKPVMKEQDIDEMIIEERERDIRKLNQDLAMVNEMFRYNTILITILLDKSYPCM